jgi:hypothetical protein
MEAITPNHFLLGRPSINLSPGVFVDKEISSRKRWRQAQVVTHHLWGRWLREYLPALALVQRAKWTQDVPNLKVGDLVQLWWIILLRAVRGHWEESSKSTEVLTR